MRAYVSTEGGTPPPVAINLKRDLKSSFALVPTTPIVSYVSFSNYLRDQEVDVLILLSSMRKSHTFRDKQVYYLGKGQANQVLCADLMDIPVFVVNYNTDEAYLLQDSADCYSSYLRPFYEADTIPFYSNGFSDNLRHAAEVAAEEGNRPRIYECSTNIRDTDQLFEIGEVVDASSNKYSVFREVDDFNSKDRTPCELVLHYVKSVVSYSRNNGISAGEDTLKLVEELTDKMHSNKAKVDSSDVELEFIDSVNAVNTDDNLISVEEDVPKTLVNPFSSSSLGEFL